MEGIWETFKHPRLTNFSERDRRLKITTKCQHCGKKTVLPSTCSYCGDYFCDEHRLPENHACQEINKWGWKNDCSSRIGLDCSSIHTLNYRVISWLYSKAYHETGFLCCGFGDSSCRDRIREFRFQDIYEKAMEFLPIIIEMGGGLKNLLPYSSIMFFVGLALGLWKG